MILIIDLDNTIYPASRGVLRAIDRRMTAYMIERLGFSPERADETRVGYWASHGTTMKGLKVSYDIDESDFLSYVHNLPVGEMLEPDRELRQALIDTPYPKFVFTNADGDHAKHVLGSLGISDVFEAVFDVTSLEFIGKPYPESYVEVERRIRNLLDGRLGDIDTRDFVFFDDYPAYLKSAKAHGWTTVHVDEKYEPESPDSPVRLGGAEAYMDFTIRTIHAFPEVVKLIERDGGKPK